MGVVILCNASLLPFDYSSNVVPMDGKLFKAEKMHLTSKHIVKVMATKFEGHRMYQINHHHRMTPIPGDKIPMMRIFYDISSVEVTVFREIRTWYDYVSSVLAIVGGAF